MSDAPASGPAAFDPAAMIPRCAERAEAVRKRNLPAVGGEERRHFIRQAELDYMDYAMIGDAEATSGTARSDSTPPVWSRW